MQPPLVQSYFNFYSDTYRVVHYSTRNFIDVLQKLDIISGEDAKLIITYGVESDKPSQYVWDYER